MLSFAQKQEAVAAMAEKFARAKGVIIADYRGLDVPGANRLRGKLREGGQGEYEYRVVKNAVLRRAVAGHGAEALAEYFRGPTAVALSYGDPIGLAKVLHEFAEAEEALCLRGGLIDGKPADAKELAQLAVLPGIDELRAKLIGLLQAPAQKIAATIQEPAAKLARVIAMAPGGAEAKSEAQRPAAAPEEKAAAEGKSDDQE